MRRKGTHEKSGGWLCTCLLDFIKLAVKIKVYFAFQVFEWIIAIATLFKLVYHFTDSGGVKPL